MCPSSDVLISSHWNSLYSQTPELEDCRPAIEMAFSILRDSLEDGHSIYVCGNGGSASDAEHIAGELAKPCAIARPLNDDLVARLRTEGDDGYLAKNVRPKDVLWALSTSGRSRNVVLAARAARASEAQVVSFTGLQGGDLTSLSHALVRTPGKDTPNIQHHHQMVYHAICLALEAHFFA